MTTEARLKETFDATLSALLELSQNLHDAQEQGDSTEIDEAERAIDEDALSVRVCDGWRNVGEAGGNPEKFEILLSTGGPASRIIGTLDEYQEVENFHIEVQDWGTPWTQFGFTGKQGDLIKRYYLSRFYFGE